MTKRIMIGVGIAGIVICGALESAAIAIKRRNDEEWDDWNSETRSAVEEAVQAIANECKDC